MSRRPGSSYTATTLADGTTYYWRVRAISGGFTGPWSAIWRVIVDTMPPATPRLGTPRDRTNTPDDTPRFTWTGVRTVDRYHLQVSDQPDFADDNHLLVNDATLTRSNLTVPDASRLPYGTYYWRVRAHDAADNWSGWSTANTFTVTVLKTPRDGDFTTDTTPVLRWATAPGATLYWLQVSTDAGFTNLLVDEDSLTGVSFTPVDVAAVWPAHLASAGRPGQRISR